MSAFSTTSNQPRINRWVGLLILMLAAEVGLLLWRLLSENLPIFSLSFAQLLPVGEKLSWYLTRSSGTVAYLTLTLSTVWGLLLSTKLVKEWVPPTVTLTMHNTLGWTAIGLSLFHAAVLLFDSYYTYTVANLLVPFTGPYAPIWVGVGTISFYLLLLVSASFYARRWIGTQTWRRLHYLTFAAFIMVTLHGWMAGTDSTQLKPLYLVAGNLVLFLTCYRMIDGIQKSHNNRQRQGRQQVVQSA